MTSEQDTPDKAPNMVHISRRYGNPLHRAPRTENGRRAGRSPGSRFERLARLPNARSRAVSGIFGVGSPLTVAGAATAVPRGHPCSLEGAVVEPPSYQRSHDRTDRYRVKVLPLLNPAALLAEESVTEAKAPTTVRLARIRSTWRRRQLRPRSPFLSSDLSRGEVRYVGRPKSPIVWRVL